ncbi:MAG: BMP family ABC transporter substrate-binding protein [Chloroflexi bacterium]|nr:BMP family ABC transporter substrate-binding protein [Chloroflexota bacterium]
MRHNAATVSEWLTRSSPWASEQKEIAEGYIHMKTRMFALLTVLALIAAACGGSTASPSASVDAGKGDYKACLSLDTGGPADKNFNQSAYEGLEALKAEGFQTAYTTAVDDASYAPNIQQLIDEGCNSVIAVGYNQGTALQGAALDAANADIAFGWVDATWALEDGTIPANFTGIDFQIDEASMLAAYLAAGISTTKVIATYGGAPYPGVTKFMDGWVAGAKYYADKKGVAIGVLGWDPVAATGTFNPSTAPFNDVVFGKTTAEAFMGQSADVVHAVAGTTGNGSYQAMMDASKYSVGVDLDQCVSLPEYCGTLLTSAQKNIGAAVITAVNSAYEGNMGGTNYIGTLENGGVQIATLDRTESAWTATFGTLVTAELKAEVEALKAAIIDGSVNVLEWAKK